jgi:hypothetical protein
MGKQRVSHAIGVFTMEMVASLTEEIDCLEKLLAGMVLVVTLLAEKARNLQSVVGPISLGGRHDERWVYGGGTSIWKNFKQRQQKIIQKRWW